MKYELLRIFPDLWFCHQEEAPLLTLIIPRNQNPQGISGRNISRRYFINVPRATAQTVVCFPYYLLYRVSFTPISPVIFCAAKRQALTQF